MSDNQALQQLLEKEVAVITQLNQLSCLKKEALLKDDLESLEQIVLKEEVLANSLRTLENACFPQVQFFLNRNKGKALPDWFTDFTGKIRQVTRELKLNNDFNQALLKDSLSLIRFTINSLTPSATGGNAVYGSSGKMVSPRKNNNLLDYKG